MAIGITGPGIAPSTKRSDTSFAMSLGRPKTVTTASARGNQVIISPRMATDLKSATELIDISASDAVAGGGVNDELPFTSGSKL